LLTLTAKRGLLTRFLLTILKLINVTAKCTVYFITNGDKVCFFILIFFLVWGVTSLVVGVLGRLPWRSPLALSVVRDGPWRFGRDWSSISASVEVNISHKTV
jgi:hypothetical protein